MDKEKLKENLTPEEYRITQEKGTEAPFSGKYHAHKEKGIYKCTVCGEPLFSSETKFDSGTGWPSFTSPEDKANIVEKEDLSHGMKRTEVICKNCGAHLGHVFGDLPRPSSNEAGQGDSKAGGPGQNVCRYCINSASLKFEKNNKK